jgi:plastocyanin
MRHLTSLLFLVATFGAAPPAAWSQPAAAPALPDEIVVELSSFAYSPDPLQLRAGVPVRLKFVNKSSHGGHDFAAPAFFAASAFPPGTTPPRDGSVDLAAGETAELTLTPRVPGTYKVRCTHLLHAWFGMTGSIVVAGPSR